MRDRLGWHEGVGRDASEQAGLVLDAQPSCVLLANNRIGGHQVGCRIARTGLPGNRNRIVVATECTAQNQRKAPAQFDVAGPFMFGLIVVYQVDQYRAAHAAIQPTLPLAELSADPSYSRLA